MAMTPFTPAELLKRFSKGLLNLHLTFVTPDGTATFASDNARHLEAFWLVQMAKLRNPARDHWCVLNKREFTPVRNVSTGLPIKRLSSCFFKGNTAIPQSADDTRQAFNVDADTGMSLPPMADVVFVDFV
jgi:hypothetical protein